MEWGAGATALSAEFWFYFYFSKEMRLGLHAEDLHEISSLVFIEKNNEKVFINVVFCSRDWHFKS